jgi:D-alanyl-D-alanine-carboxypeptidase/D-alanyl-D-alanine-endopeptidase
MRPLLRAGCPLLLLAVLSAPAALHAQQPSFDVERARPAIEAAIRAELEKGTASVSIALVSGDRIVWTAAYGYANATTRSPATPATIYSTGSSSKSVTATAIMQLVEQGRLDLDQPVNRYLRDARLMDRLQSERPVTVRMLLDHTSGLTCDVRVRPVFSRSLPPTLRELTERTYSIRPPGERFEYCNSAYGIAGYLIEQVTGQEYESYIVEHILAPLGVTTPAPIRPTAEMVERMAQTYRRGDDGRPVPVERVFYDVYPAGDLYMTAEDMARFLGAHLNGGVFNGRRILSEASVREMHRDHSSGRMGARESAALGPAYGLGLGASVDADGHTIIQHGGAVPGLTAGLYGDVTAGIGVYVMTNSGGVNEIVRAAMDAMRAASPAAASDRR